MALRVSFSVIAAAAVSLAGLVSAHGQSVPPPDRTGLGEVVQLDEIVVTATKTPTAAVDAMAATSAVSGEQIEVLQPTRAGEILQNVPGVTTPESPNDPGQAVNIRGLQDFGRVNVLVDGARQDYQVSGHNANGTYYIDPEFIGGAEVTRGPVSNIYGSGAIGGVVAYSTKGVDDVLAPNQTYGVLQRFGVASNGSEFLNSSAAAVRYGAFADIYGQFVYRGQDAYRDGSGTTVQDTGSKLVGGLFKANIRPDDGHQISISALEQDYRFTNNGTSAAGSRFSDDLTAGTYSIGYTFSRPDIKWLNFSAKVYYTTTENLQTAIAPDATYQALNVVPGDQLSDRIGTAGFDIHNTSLFETGAVRHALTYGGDSAFDNVNTADAAGGFVSALTPSGNRRISGAFVQDEASYNGWLRAIGAVRYDDYELQGGSFRSGGSRVSPKITVGVTPIRGIEFYGTYAEGYRAPSVTETLLDGTHPFPAFNILPNLNLSPEVAHNVEGGVNIKYDSVFTPGDKIRGKVNGFSNIVDNYIDIQPVGASYLVPFIPGLPVSTCQTAPFLCFPIQSFQYDNIAKARLQGVELEAGYDVGWGYVSVAGQHIDSKNITTDEPLVSSIPDRISTTLGARLFNQRLTMGTRLTFVAPSVVLPSSTESVFIATKGYNLVDLFATYRFNDNVLGDLYVKNLFNREYTQYLNTLPNPGLSVRAALTVRFAS